MIKHFVYGNIRKLCENVEKKYYFVAKQFDKIIFMYLLPSVFNLVDIIVKI